MFGNPAGAAAITAGVVDLSLILHELLGCAQAELRRTALPAGAGKSGLGLSSASSTT
jgi:hypothetical protein